MSVPKKRKFEEGGGIEKEVRNTEVQKFILCNEKDNAATEAGKNAYRILKFGGSSVGGKIEQVVEVIKQEESQRRVVVIVSAMGNTTDWLIDACDAAAAGQKDRANEFVDKVRDLAVTNAAKFGLKKFEEVSSVLAPLRQVLLGISLLREKTPSSLDTILSFGEQLSARTVSWILNNQNIVSSYVDSRTWLVTDDNFGCANVLWDETLQKLTEVSQSWPSISTPVSTGFIGSSLEGKTTTLGRNGSDFSATLMARGLKASDVVINTDVPGVFTADPRIVKDAYPVPDLSYFEALELAIYGTDIFHPRTMLPLIKAGIPMIIRNTSDPAGPATTIHAAGGARPAASPNVSDSEDNAKPLATCVTSLERLALLDVRSRIIEQQNPHQIGRRVLSCMEKSSIRVCMSTQNAQGQSASVVIYEADLGLARDALTNEFKEELQRMDLDHIHATFPVTLLSLVAERMRDMKERGNAAAKFFQSLGVVGVEPRAIGQGSTSRSISCVIDAKDTPLAVRTVHSAFNFVHQSCSVLIVGNSAVGIELGKRIVARRETLREDHGVDLTPLVAVKSPQTNRIAIQEVFHSSMMHGKLPTSGELACDPAIEELSRLSAPIVVDCSDASGGDSELLYRECHQRGVHVVVSNAANLSSLSEISYKALVRGRKACFSFDSCVGAGLPVLESLRNFLEAGDRPKKIVCALSGSINFMFHWMKAEKTSFADAAREAFAQQYTESDLWDDLSGKDVTNKIRMMLRQLNIKPSAYHCETVPVISVPKDEEREPLNSRDGMNVLEQYNAAVEAELRDPSHRLVYLTNIELRESRVSAITHLASVPSTHPVYGLPGSDVWAAFYTQRYGDHPLIIQGAGAGPQVAAAGVLNDIMRVSRQLKGHSL